MTLWRYVVELPDGSRQENVVRAGNREGAEARAARFAGNKGGRVVEGPKRLGPS